MYENRFSHVVQLMPFYTGKDSDIIRVFGNSVHFHGYIAQARRPLLEIPCDRYLFIGDDLILNPAINESTIGSLMKLDADSCYYPCMFDVSKGEYYRATMEARKFQLPPQGLDHSALKGIPSYEESFRILHKKGLMETTRLQAQPFFPLFVKPWLKCWRKNYQVMRGRLWHLRNSLNYRLKCHHAAYPVVFGYSDIFSIPRVHFDAFCDYLEVFASLQMFVELAIPTAFALHDWPMVFERELELEPFSLLFPPDPRLMKEKAEKILSMATTANFRVEELERVFPKNYLYMHPIKLSKWS